MRDTVAWYTGVKVLEPQFRQPFQNVNRWFTTLIHQPQFEAVIGKNFSLCEKMAQFDGVCCL